MGFWDTAKRVGAGVATGGLSELYYNDALKEPARRGGEYEGVDRNNFVNPAYEGANQSLNQFANNYGGSQFRGGQTMLSNLLMGQATGKDSFSAEKLRQDTARLQAQQQSMAASAGPANKAMALRNAQANAGQAGVGMAGNAALAGIQERTSAANALGGVLQGARGQDINAYLGAQQQLGQNYANQLQGTMGYEANRTQRYGAAVGVPTYGEVGLGALTGLGGLMAGKSDKNVKENVKELAPVGIPKDELTSREVGGMPKGGRFDATRRFYETTSPDKEPLKWYEFNYKPGEGPKGKFVGPMAQDVEKVAPQAVFTVDGVKHVDYERVPPALLKPGAARVAASGVNAKPTPGLAQALVQPKRTVVDMSRGSMRPAIEQVESMARRPRVMRIPGNTDLSTDLKPISINGVRVEDEEAPLMRYVVRDPRR